MQDARNAIYRHVSDVRGFLAQEQPPRLSESDTKANFIDPIVKDLGWQGINVVTREYYVRNSQEFIDYVMRGPNGLLLAIEAKPIQTELTDKHAAQLVQYCVVEGIEWAALTNGRELQFFNTFLKPDLAAKRVLRLDLLAFNTNDEFDIIFGQLWQLSRQSMTQPSGVRTWLHQKRMDDALRQILLDPGTPSSKQLRKQLQALEINASAMEITQWFRAHLAPSLLPTTIAPPRTASTSTTPGAVSPPTPGASRRRLKLEPEPASPFYPPPADDSPLMLNDAPAPQSRADAPDPPSRPRLTRRQAPAKPGAETRPKAAYYGVGLPDLLAAGLLPAGSELVMVGHGGRVIAEATLTPDGKVLWRGTAYRSLSDRAFAGLLGHQSVNGWLHWSAIIDGVRVPLLTLRERLRADLDAQADDATGTTQHVS